MSVEMVLCNIFSTFIQSLSVGIIIFCQIPGIIKNKKIKFILGVWIYCLISSFVIPNQFRFVLFIVAMSVLMYFILNINDKKIILYAFINQLIFSLSEIIVSLILVSIGFDSKSIADDFTINLVLNLLISTLAVLLIFIPFIKKVINAIIRLFNNNKNLSNYLIIFLIMIYIIVSKNGLEFIMESNYYINIVFIVGIIVIISIVMKSESKAEQLKEINNQMINHVTKYEKIITEQGKANHEFKNQLMVIRGYAQMKSDKLIDYIDSIIKDSKKTYSSYLISQLNKFPAGGIKGLLYYKLSTMDEEKITHELNVESGVKIRLDTLGIESYKNITKMLGVLFDNAIDASKKSKNKKIIINVVKKTNSVTFSIYNTYRGKINIDELGTGFTTKGSGHGYGLRLVKDIIESSNIFELENLIENEYYVTRLVIKTKRMQTKKEKVNQ